MKKLNKKLTLNKETIASLNDAQMGAVKGGITSIGCTKKTKCKNRQPCANPCPPAQQ